jgi:hypothetical protein
VNDSDADPRVKAMSKPVRNPKRRTTMPPITEYDEVNNASTMGTAVSSLLIRGGEAIRALSDARKALDDGDHGAVLRIIRSRAPSEPDDLNYLIQTCRPSDGPQIEGA